MSRAGSVIALILFLAGCYEPKEGCLDPQAVNYDVTADEACAECCTWPSLRLSVKHRFVPPDQPDTLVALKYHEPLRVFPDTSHPFLLERFRVWISHVHLLSQNGEEYSVLETLPVSLPDGTTVTLEDNFAVADRDIFTAQTLGTLRADGYMSGVRLRIGLDSLERSLDPASLESGHPLRTWADSILFDADAGYFSGRARVVPDTTLTDTLDVAWLQPVEVALMLDEPVFLPKGSNIEVTLVINYTELFDGIDFAATTADELRFQFVARLPMAVKLEHIQAN